MVTLADMSEARIRLAVYICTHRRNDELRAAIRSLAVAAKRANDRVDTGVIVIDDNPDGRAAAVAAEFGDGDFALGCTYRHSGQQNISIARNLGIETALGIGDWVAMIDDDEVVVEDWVVELVGVQERTGADAVTGPVFVNYADDGPSWLVDEPVAELFTAPLADDGSVVETCSTGNSMIRAEWLRAHPDLRFRTDLGGTGGEDMVFFRTAIAEGMAPVYARHARADEDAGAARSTLGYVLRRSLWMGNTTVVTNLATGASSRARLSAKAGKALVRAAAHPVRRITQGRSPQFRYALCLSAYAVGIAAGIVGVEVEHR